MCSWNILDFGHFWMIFLILYSRAYLDITEALWKKKKMKIFFSLQTWKKYLYSCYWSCSSTSVKYFPKSAYMNYFPKSAYVIYFPTSEYVKYVCFATWSQHKLGLVDIALVKANMFFFHSVLCLTYFTLGDWALMLAGIILHWSACLPLKCTTVHQRFHSALCSARLTIVTTTIMVPCPIRLNLTHLSSRVSFPSDKISPFFANIFTPGRLYWR